MNLQIGADGRRSQIYLALSTAAEFRDHLSSFSDYYSSLGLCIFFKLNNKYINIKTSFKKRRTPKY